MKDLKEAKANGMRFWTKGTLLGTVPPEMRRADSPFPKNGIPVAFRAPNIEYPRGKKFEFLGETFVDDPDVAFKLMKYESGVLMFDPQEAVDKLGIDPESIRALGLQVADKGEAQHVPKEPAVPMPNFHVMRKKELREWADAHQIFIPEQMAKDDMVKYVEAELAKKTESNQEAVPVDNSEL